MIHIYLIIFPSCIVQFLVYFPVEIEIEYIA